LSATLVRGVDRFGYFDQEPSPIKDNDKASISAHAESLAHFQETF